MGRWDVGVGGVKRGGFVGAVWKNKREGTGVGWWGRVGTRSLSLGRALASLGGAKDRSDNRYDESASVPRFLPRPRRCHLIERLNLLHSASHPVPPPSSLSFWITGKTRARRERGERKKYTCVSFLILFPSIVGAYCFSHFFPLKTLPSHFALSLSLCEATSDSLL